MKHISLIFSVVVALDLFVGTNVLARSKQDTKTSVEWDDSLSDETKVASPQKTKSEIKSEPRSEIREDTCLNEALEMVQQLVINRFTDQIANQNEVFLKLRSAFSEKEFSSEELMILIEDAMEIKKKYLLIFDFVIRSEYARRAVEEGINADEALQFASSEYIQLPKFILKKKVDDNKLNDVLSDLGCGVVWKDRAKYSFVLRKYFRKNWVKINREECSSLECGVIWKDCAKYSFVLHKCFEKNGAKISEREYYSKRVQNYLKLIAKVDKFFEKSYKHFVYLIAQDFYYADIPQEKIQKIFSFSDEDLKSLIKPNNYE